MQSCDLRDTRYTSDESGEHIGQSNLGYKAEAKFYVRYAVAIVVDEHAVGNVGIKGEVVGAIGGLQQWIDVENHGYAIGMVITDERVPVSNVGAMVESS